jgi:hypothetical protein
MTALLAAVAIGWIRRLHDALNALLSSLLTYLVVFVAVRVAPEALAGKPVDRVKA